ncbi:kinase-like domain-containing protein [Sphaerosporella brunnea]|uniref:Kinase-like domain-containing protein n=1 Tax=Sphaerosporella brunnea TaxID=1250544 RepID=A0A5J5F1X9_9PEZI|nr:kinase-like domain-containing protein [Sphaerosporella brunnea]
MLAPDEAPPAAATAAAAASPQLSREQPVRHISAPVVGVLRHHRRTPSIGRAPIKETLDASFSYDDDEEGGGVRINQYVLKEEIGRGSFGAVHLAEDQLGNKYAVKEFSKSKLRRRSQSLLLRQPGRRLGFLDAQGHRRSASELYQEQEGGNPLFLIREEIAILKKLDHENIVNLIEVLDDPEGDSLYMVLEWCEKGVVMNVDLDKTAKPYPEEQCRLWFRDMILGIEYLHAQGIVHRDIKPDNLLLTANEVLKIVDFGVSEMFEKNVPMMTAKSAGSPAFFPPELCVAGHGDISGTAADIWSMGVTLYCLLFGRLPFSNHNIIELCDSIKHDDVRLPDDVDPELADLLHKILEKDPAKRIKMPELREHPWVTRGGEDRLLPTEENTADFIMPTQEEMETAITKSIHNVMAVVRAVRKLKRLTLSRFKPAANVPLPHVDATRRTQSLNLDERGHHQQELSAAGHNKEISLDTLVDALPSEVELDSPRIPGTESHPAVEVQMADSTDLRGESRVVPE